MYLHPQTLLRDNRHSGKGHPLNSRSMLSCQVKIRSIPQQMAFLLCASIHFQGEREDLHQDQWQLKRTSKPRAPNPRSALMRELSKPRGSDSQLPTAAYSSPTLRSQDFWTTRCRPGKACPPPYSHNFRIRERNQLHQSRYPSVVYSMCTRGPRSFPTEKDNCKYDKRSNARCKASVQESLSNGRALDPFASLRANARECCRKWASCSVLGWYCLRDNT